jgi:hypothetical protein
MVLSQFGEGRNVNELIIWGGERRGEQVTSGGSQRTGLPCGLCAAKVFATLFGTVASPKLPLRPA